MQKLIKCSQKTFPGCGCGGYHSQIDRHCKSNYQGQGRNWLRPEKRLALYLRDGMACAYCGVSVEEEGTLLTLDHLEPYVKGGSNHASNLITACNRCNSSRGTRDWKIFAKYVAQYINHGITSTKIIKHIQAKISQPIDVPIARLLLARRGSWAAALKS